MEKSLKKQYIFNYILFIVISMSLIMLNLLSYTFDFNDANAINNRIHPTNNGFIDNIKTYQVKNIQTIENGIQIFTKFDEINEFWMHSFNIKKTLPTHYYKVYYKDKLIYKTEKYYNDEIVTYTNYTYKDGILKEKKIYEKYNNKDIFREKVKHTYKNNKLEKIVTVNTNQSIKHIIEILYDHKNRIKEKIIKHGNGLRTNMKYFYDIKEKKFKYKKAIIKYNDDTPIKAYYFNNFDCCVKIIDLEFFSGTSLLYYDKNLNIVLYESYDIKEELISKTWYNKAGRTKKMISNNNIIEYKYDNKFNNTDIIYKDKLGNILKHEKLGKYEQVEEEIK